MFITLCPGRGRIESVCWDTHPNGNSKATQVRIYLSRMVSGDIISKAMPCNQFFYMQNNLHFLDKSTFTEEKKQENRLFLVDPIVSYFREACLMLPRSQNVCRRANRSFFGKMSFSAVRAN